MPFTVDYVKKTNCIKVTVQGKLDLELLQNLAAEVSAILESKGCRRILNDMTNAIPTNLTIDIYNMPKKAKEAGVAQAVKRALLVKEKTFEFRFLETVFINQGHYVKMFTDPDEATVWLFNNKD